MKSNGNINEIKGNNFVNTTKPQHIIDLRSDMMSMPDEQQLSSLDFTKFGVDSMGECEYTQELEAYAADLFQMEKALFFPTGVMANLAAVMAHVPQYQEVIVGQSSHIFSHEGGGVSILGGIPIKTVSDEDGILNESELRSRIGNGSFFSTKTGLICIENPHNDAAGIANKPEAYQGILDIARTHKVPIHLDGARIFNACSKYGLHPHEYAKGMSSLMFCLNKGLRAPAGALLLGTSDFISRTSEIRKLLGGGLCQPSLLSQFGLKALRGGWAHLKADNENAESLISGLKDSEKVNLKPASKTTNIVYIYLSNNNKAAHEYIPEFEQRGIKLLANDVAFRAVFHSHMTPEDVQNVTRAFNEIIQ